MDSNVKVILSLYCPSSPPLSLSSSLSTPAGVSK